ncbi:hypothetical protein Glove_443g1 [Diversispora epigaea]|uniref:SWIM-type domain-containing protein n=1 Tax=Diversispora epigaea TaxID=1348612 RepID=A0A397GQN3_9GLOM|nr:hypothetical protein Glove_443g1 [Diversispora epigaea]
MNPNTAEIEPVNVVDDIQDMEDIENINVDKDNFFTSEDISKDTKFDTWDKVENYFDEYGSRNGSMNPNTAEIEPVNVVDDIQDMEDIENINVDKDNFFTSEDISKDTKFDTWDKVENYFDEYGSRNGFAIVKYRMERNSKGQVHKRTFVCEFSGKYKSKKKTETALKGIQRNTKTKKLSCPWHINLTFPEHSIKIIITTFINQHNHPLVSKTQEFVTKYRLFTDEALKEISLMTKHGNLSLTAQRNLLKARFPNLHFQDQDLANAIQKYKNINKINNDASTLLTSLLQKKIEDLRWVVDFELDKENQLTRLLWMSPDQIDLWLKYYDVVVNDNTAKTNQYQMLLGIFIIIDNKCKTRLVCQALVSDETLDTHVWILECIRKATEQAPIVMFTDANPALDAAIPIVFPETYPAHCIFHIAQNLPKNLKGKLGERWNDFIKQFYQCRNSLCEPLFKQRWNQLLNDFPASKDYLLRTLGRNCRSWARAYLYKIFTAGIESTSRIEGYNWVIKQQLKTNSTLCELVDCLDSRLKEEERWNQFYEYKQITTSNIVSTVGQDLFLTITKVLDKYLTEPIYNIIRAEMSQCLFVNANIINPSDEELNREQENFQRMSDEFIEDQYDARFITLQTMIEEVGKDEILEIWKVVDIQSERKHHIHFVIIINAISFLCSCLKSISRGIICRHYFRVIMNSETAAFHISMIAQQWYKDIYQDGVNPQESIVFSERNTHNNDRATLLAVEQEDDEITTFLRDYIRKKSDQNIYERPANNEISVINKSPVVNEIKRPANDEIPANEILAVDKRPMIDEISNDTHELRINEGDTSAELESSQMEEDKTEQDNEIINTNLENIKNPNKVTNKGCPSKRRYLSSVEKEQGSRGGSKTRGSYRCRVCNQVGHNAAFHKSVDK